MVALGRALTSLVLVTALAGSPALVSLCLVACVPGAADAAAVVSTVEPSAAEHAHHGATGSSHAAADGTVAASPAQPARVDGECHDCCAGASTVFDAGMAGDRPGAVATPAAPGAWPAGPAVLIVARASRPLPPPVFPPAPVRASLVLRI